MTVDDAAIQDLRDDLDQLRHEIAEVMAITFVILLALAIATVVALVLATR